MHPCGKYQPYEWGRIRISDVTMECKYCGEHFKETEWKERPGKWIAGAENQNVVVRFSASFIGFPSLPADGGNLSISSINTILIGRDASPAAEFAPTIVILNTIGYYIDYDPSPILCLQPTLEMAQAFSKDRLAKMIRDTPVLIFSSTLFSYRDFFFLICVLLAFCIFHLPCFAQHGIYRRVVRSLPVLRKISALRMGAHPLFRCNNGVQILRQIFHGNEMEKEKRKMDCIRPGNQKKARISYKRIGIPLDRMERNHFMFQRSQQKRFPHLRL